jgi:hypothetical protein
VFGMAAPRLDDPLNRRCDYCGAVTWKEERINCCQNGTQVVPLHECPESLRESFYATKSVITHCRSYNGVMSFGALGSSKAYARLFNPDAEYSPQYNVQNGPRAYGRARI